VLFHILPKPHSKTQQKSHTRKNPPNQANFFRFQINAVNFVSAALSTPALPEAIGSRTNAAHLKLSPLPNMVSTLSIREQLQRHREKMLEMQELLNGLRETAPSLKAKGKPVYEYFYRERFIEKEHQRYKTYVEILVRNLSPSSRPDSRNNLNSVMTNF
jgi:hypothetical protein